MNTNDLPTEGAASAELAQKAQQRWIETAVKAGLDLGGFNPESSLRERIAWAMGKGLDIGTVLSRFSSTMQHSTESQVMDNVEFAAWHGIYAPPEYLCVDEAVSGRKARRVGLDRVRMILKLRLAQTLLVYKVSRLFRVAYKGFQFFNEDVVEEGLRAISVSQGIDTKDEKAWKSLAYLHGLMDEMLLDTIADSVRSGIRNIFLSGYVTGALPVGYHAVEVPAGRPTNRGLPRTMPAVTPDVAERIRQHFQWIRDGMSVTEGCRRWVEAGGPCDPRSTLGRMSYGAYRRMLSNPRYTGLWAFGRKRNNWSSKLDYNRPVVQPDTEVAVFRCEELRIVEDAVFNEVQVILARYKQGPRGPKKRKEPQLWDLATEFFWCPHCKVRYYQGGSKAHAMQCKNGPLCPCTPLVNRKESVEAVCRKLTELLHQDADLIAQVVTRSVQLDAQGDEAVEAEIQALERQIAARTAKISDLMEIAGHGSDRDREETKARIREAQSQRAEQESRRAHLLKAQAAGRAAITPEKVRVILADLTQLLQNGAGGLLGDDVVYKALAVFRQLTGGRIWVHVEARPGRKRTNVRGVFRPQLLQTVQQACDVPALGEEGAEVEVWLRPPPRLDQLAERVHQLMDIENMSFRDVADVLQREGHKVNSGNVWYIYRRYYQMKGQPMPRRLPSNGRSRRSA